MNDPESKLSASDILMDVVYHRFVRSDFKPKHFYEAISPHPTNEDKTITETDLPIVSEALEATQEAKERNQISTESHNPWGENLQSATIYTLSDAHQPGSNPENSVFYTHKLFKFIESLNPRSIKYKLTKALLGLQGKYGEDWLLEARPSLHVDALRVTLESILKRVKNNKPTHGSENSAQAIIDLGDRNNPESTMGDVAFTALEFVQALDEAESSQLKMTAVSGNHDADINNHGFVQEIFQRQLFESPVIIQYVGEYVVLTLNTNLWSHFWNIDLDKEKARFEELKLQGELYPDGEHLRINRIIHMYEDFFVQMEAEKQRQTDYINEAIESGKKIAIFAHEEEGVLKNFPLERSRLTHIFCGHLETATQKELEQKNADGDNIRLVRAGSVSSKLSGEVDWPTSYEIQIDGDSLEVSELEIDKNAEQMKYSY